MARYCSASDVKLIIQTELDDEFIERLIDLSDADLERKLGGASMSGDTKKDCSMMLTAIRIAKRSPQTYSIGSIKIDHGSRIEDWRKEVNKMVARAIGKWDVVDPT